MTTRLESRFVGVRMEDGIKTCRTYGFARNAQGRIEQVYAVVQHARTVSQQWTGKTYRSEREAAAESGRLNSRAVQIMEEAGSDYRDW